MNNKPAYKIIFIILLLIAMALTVHAQQKTDSVRVNSDTLHSKQEKIVYKVQALSHKQNLIGKLLRKVWVDPKPFVNISPVPSSGHCLIDDSFCTRYIRAITIKVLDPFGPAIDQPFDKPVNWLERKGNGLHYNTREWVVKENLLFKVGDKLNQYKMAESERLLRQNSYITDARVVVNVSKSCCDSADVIVIVMDVFSLNGVASVAYPNINGTASLNENNFLGLGHTLQNQVWYNPTWPGGWKYNGGYTVPQIEHTYITGQAYFNDGDNNEKFGFLFTKPFATPTMKWAGGLGGDWENNPYSFPVSDTQNLTGKDKYHVFDGWLARSFTAKGALNDEGPVPQFILAGRITNTKYSESPFNEEPLAVTYQSHTLFLATVAFSYRSYVKDHYVFGFGKTEDIPIGHLLLFTAGVDDAQLYTRYYMGGKWSFSMLRALFGYFYGSIETGGYEYEHQWQQMIGTAQVLYFTNLIPMHKWKMRQYILNRFSEGYNLMPGQVISENSGIGIRGLNINLPATQKYVANYEADIFSPRNVLGFETVGVFFADFELLGTSSGTLFRSLLYQGYGIGVRFKNEHLIFNTVQFSFAWYPQATFIGAREFAIQSTQSPYYQFQDFQFSQPYTIGF